MLDAGKYRQYAADCRAIAQTMSGAARDTLQRIAEAWDEMALAREIATRRKDPNALESEAC